MKITITGKPGSGKSSLSRALSEHYKLKYISTGNCFRNLALEKGISVIELNKKARTDSSYDLLLTQQLKDLADKNDIVIDSRLGYHFIPDSIKIYLDVDLHTAARRILNADRQTESYLKLEDVITEIRTRIDLERERYIKHFGVDINDTSVFDIKLDTTNMSKSEVLFAVIHYIEQQKNAILSKNIIQ